jgi:serine/threonine-protein kinase
MEQLGKYRIEAKLGEGAMGFVYKAWHPGFNDYVALKIIQDTRLEGKELLERFKLEGQALAKLKHQNIVQIYDADQANGVHFIVMEYMNGGSLDRIITRRDESRPLAKRVGYMVSVCYALDYAHKRRLFHRDIKPANIMLHVDGSEEIVKVVDFGIAHLVDSSQTQTKLLIGAPAYMAPGTGDRHFQGE